MILEVFSNLNNSMNVNGHHICFQKLRLSSFSSPWEETSPCPRVAQLSSAMSFGVPVQRALELRLHREALGAGAQHSEPIATSAVECCWYG